MSIETSVAWGAGRGQREAEPVCPVRLEEGVSVVICTRGRPDVIGSLLRSLAGQTRPPDELIVVDASDGRASEVVVAASVEGFPSSTLVRYVRVNGPFLGLTRQRNLGTGLASRDLVAYFDDDVVVAPGSLAAMERTYREGQGAIVGVGASVVPPERPSRGIWYLRRALWIVPSLQPGRYFGSGMSTPWDASSFSKTMSVDWLPGCGMLWPTALVRRQQFREEFEGYAQGEDLEFSVRASRSGRLVIAVGAEVRDTHAPTGRPRGVARGYFGLRNRFLIHRLVPGNRRLSRVSWFVYSWTADTVLLLRHIVYPRRWGSVAQEVAGRLLAGWDLVRGHAARRFEKRGTT